MSTVTGELWPLAPHLLADVQHGRLVPLRLPDHDGAFEHDGVERSAHGFHGGLAGGLGISHPRGARRRDSGLLHHVKHIEREAEHVVAFSSWTTTQS